MRTAFIFATFLRDPLLSLVIYISKASRDGLRMPVISREISQLLVKISLMGFGIVLTSMMIPLAGAARSRHELPGAANSHQGPPGAPRPQGATWRLSELEKRKRRPREKPGVRQTANANASPKLVRIANANG